MAWIIMIVIAFWGLPLATLLAVGLACMVSERFRYSAARILGLVADPTSSPERGKIPPPQARRRA